MTPLPRSGARLRVHELGLLLLVFVSCQGREEIPIALEELQGDREQRVSQALRFLLHGAEPPSAVVDAHCAEERIGDGILGPSDRRTYCGWPYLRIQLFNLSKVLAHGGQP